jgi:hypothetical protein
LLRVAHGHTPASLPPETVALGADAYAARQLALKFLPCAVALPLDSISYAFLSEK